VPSFPPPSAVKAVLQRCGLRLRAWAQPLLTRAGRWIGRLPGGLPAWITLVCVGFVLAALGAQGAAVWQLRPDAQGWIWLLLAVGVSLLSLVVAALAWGGTLRWLGWGPRWEPLLLLYLRSNLRKYLPGGVWHLGQRLEALRRADAPLQGGGIGTAQALLATLLEPLLAALAALALVSVGGWQGGLGLLVLLPLLLLLPRWWAPLLRWLEQRRARSLGLAAVLEAEQARDPGAGLVLGRTPWPPLLLQGVFVLLRFGGFACCVAALDLQASADWPLLLAGFALAWTAGLVVPGAPGGLGVFEAVLLLRLGAVVPEAPLLSLALSYRLVVTLADLLAAGLARLDQKFSTASIVEK